MRLITIDRDTPMLLPVDLRAWVPDNHLVHVIVDAVERLPMAGFKVNHRGTGNKQYPPQMMLSLIIYNYATGRFSSREIEAATFSDVIVRYICGGDTHPDHDTICAFRRENGEAFELAFVKVLGMARELGVLRACGGASVDGTKISANASKHAAVSYDKQELLPSVATIAPAIREVNKVLADAGFYSDDAVANSRATCYIAVGRQSHHRSIEAVLNPSAEPAAPSADAEPIDIMRHRLATPVGKAIYARRKQTVEPVFGIIKEAMGFRRFLLRGIGNVSLEWTLVTLAYNCRRLYSLKNAEKATEKRMAEKPVFAVAG